MDLKVFPDIQTLAMGFLSKGTIHCLARRACSLPNPLAAYADCNVSFVTFHTLCLVLGDDMRPCPEKVWKGHLIKRDTDSLYLGGDILRSVSVSPKKHGPNPKLISEVYRGFGSDHLITISHRPMMFEGFTLTVIPLDTSQRLARGGVAAVEGGDGLESALQTTLKAWYTSKVYIHVYIYYIIQYIFIYTFIYIFPWFFSETFTSE